MYGLGVLVWDVLGVGNLNEMKVVGGFLVRGFTWGGRLKDLRRWRLQEGVLDWGM